MKSELILIYNALAYIFVFLFFWSKDRYKLGVKNIGFLWLAFSACASYMFYIQADFIYTMHYSIMTIHPFVYLIICLVILYYPLRKIEVNDINWNMHFLPIDKYEKIRNFCLPFLFYLLIGYTYAAMNVSVADMAEVRADLYDSAGSANPFFSIWITSTISRFFSQNIAILYCLSFYSLVVTKSKGFADWSFIVLPYVIGFEISFSTATRATILFMVMIIIFQYLLYRNLLSHRQDRIFKFSIFSVGGLLGFLLVAMSVARFAEGAELFYYKYAGEAMINFNGIMFDHLKGTTDGQAYFWYLPEKLGLMDLNYKNLSEKWAFIEGRTGVTGMIFYTVVGALLFEFGKIWTPIIILIISLLLGKLFSKKMNGRTLILISWCAYQLIACVFLLPIQGDGGAISIVSLILLYIYMKDRRNVSYIPHQQRPYK